jgi:hypothetical protein
MTKSPSRALLARRENIMPRDRILGYKSARRIVEKRQHARPEVNRMRIKKLRGAQFPIP